MISSIKYAWQVYVILLTAMCSFLGHAAENHGEHIDHASYESIKRAVFHDPYDVLPQYTVSADLFGDSGQSDNNKLLRAAQRTLTQDDDLLDFPDKQKLFQPNGICYAGIWRTEHELGYSGLYRTALSVPVIVRASVMLSGTKVRDKRAFGLAVKLFPSGRGPSKNVLLMESMGGSYLNHVLDAVVDNHPRLGSLPRLKDLGVALRIRKDLTRAEKARDDGIANIRFRTVQHLARIDEVGNAIEAPSAPYWLRLTASSNLPRVKADDFRDELNVNRYPNNKIVYEIDVAEQGSGKKREALWHKLGELILEESVTSHTCDKRLHFAHPSH